MEYENLTGTLTEFRDAVHKLIGPTVDYIEGHIRTGDSLYEQLIEATESGNLGGQHLSNGARSLPPVWIDGLDLLCEIDCAVSIWQTARVPAGEYETIHRLQLLSEANYRPQDVRMIQQITNAILDWTTRTDELLNPKPVVYLHGRACPVCNHHTVYRQDSGGEWVRTPALKVEPGTGITCQNRKCRDQNGRPTHWTMDKALFLGQLLNCPPPEGITA
jgi:hypothetical protein